MPGASNNNNNIHFDWKSINICILIHNTQHGKFNRKLTKCNQQILTGRSVSLVWSGLVWIAFNCVYRLPSTMNVWQMVTVMTLTLNKHYLFNNSWTNNTWQPSIALIQYEILSRKTENRSRWIKNRNNIQYIRNILFVCVNIYFFDIGHPMFGLRSYSIILILRQFDIWFNNLNKIKNNHNNKYHSTATAMLPLWI